MAGNRVADHKTVSVIWVEDIASDDLIPTVTEVLGGTDYTCDIEKGSALPSFTGDKTSTGSGSLCEDTDIETWQGSVYGAEITFFRRFTNGKRATDDVTITLPAPGEYGYWVVREGVPIDTAFVAGDIVDVFSFQAGVFQKMRGTGENTLRGKVKYFQAGKARAEVVVAAAA